LRPHRGSRRDGRVLLELLLFHHAVGFDRGPDRGGRARPAIDILDQALLRRRARLGKKALLGCATLARPHDLQRILAALRAIRVHGAAFPGGRRTGAGAADHLARLAGIAGPVLIHLAAPVHVLRLRLRADQRHPRQHDKPRCGSHVAP
jgi:hypothetical protein